MDSPSQLGFRPFHPQHLVLLIVGSLLAIAACFWRLWFGLTFVTVAACWVAEHAFRISTLRQLVGGIFLMAALLNLRFVWVEVHFAPLIVVCGMLVAVVWEMLTPEYHGVGWQWINPSFPEWLEKNRGRRN